MRPRSRLPRALATGGLVLAPLLAACGGHPGAVPPPVSATPTATATPTPDTTVSAGGLDVELPAGQRLGTGFAPAAVSFLSPQLGWALGSRPCPAEANQLCAAYLRTADSGATWRQLSSPDVSVTEPFNTPLLAVADPGDAYVADSTVLQATHDGGLTWQDDPLPGLAPDRVEAMAVIGGELDVLAGPRSGGGEQQLLRAPATTGTFQPLAGLALPPSGGTVSLAAQGSRGWLTVSSAEPDAVPFYARTEDGTRWQRATAPCGPGAVAQVTGAAPVAVDLLGFPVPTATPTAPTTDAPTTTATAGPATDSDSDRATATDPSATGTPAAGSPSATSTPAAPADVAMLCTGAVAGTQATKTLWTSTDGGIHFLRAGETGLAGYGAGVALSADGAVVIAATSDGDTLYRSRDGGARFAVVFASGPVAQSGGLGLSGLTLVDARHGLVILGETGVYASDLATHTPGVPPPRLLTTLDGGAHWTEVGFSG